MGNWKPPQFIRATAQAVIQRKQQLLVYEGFDSKKNEKFYRPIGGTVEFLEFAAQTVIREFKEEANIDIKNPQPIGTLENIFIYEGHKGHEIVQVFKCEFANIELYSKEIFPLIEGERSLGNAVWKDISYLTRDDVNFYPSGIKKIALDLID